MGHSDFDGTQMNGMDTDDDTIFQGTDDKSSTDMKNQERKDKDKDKECKEKEKECKEKSSEVDSHDGRPWSTSAA